MQTKKAKLGNVPPSQVAQEIKDEIINKCKLLATGKLTTASPIVSLSRELIALEKDFPNVAPEKTSGPGTLSEPNLIVSPRVAKAAKSSKQKRVKRVKRKRPDEDDF